MDDSDVFQGVLAPGERLLWSGPKETTSSDFAVLGAVMFLGAMTMPLVAALLTGHVKFLPAEAKRVYPLLAFIAFGVLNIALALSRSRSDAKTAYAVTNRRLLCAVGDQRDGVRGAALKHLDVPEIQSSGRYGLSRLVMFRLRKVPSGTPHAMWSFVESGNPDPKLSHYWSVTSPSKVAGIAARAICAIETTGEMALADHRREQFQ